jgi:hypothetical protein
VGEPVRGRFAVLDDEAGRFDSALLSNDVPYSRLHIAWGSHAVSNRLLSSKHFQVVDDAADLARFEKIQLLTQWPEAMRHLRVAGVPLPEAFATDVNNRQIRRMRFHTEQNACQWMEAVSGAELHGLGKVPWVRAARTAIRRNRRRWRWRWLKQAFRPLRNRIRTLCRGSPLSRRQLQARAKPTSGGEE